MDEYNVAKSIIAQMEYCAKKGYPHFAPTRGVCWSCGRNIYAACKHKYGDREFVTGITTEKAGSELVTGCPHCNRSYCD